MPQIINEDLQVKGLLSIDGESTGVIVDAQGLKRVGLMKYADRETGIWRLNNQDFEIGRVDAKVTALPGKPTAFTADLYVAGDGKVGIGTSNPTYKLHVVGDVSVTGSLAAGRIDESWVSSDGKSGAGVSYSALNVTGDGKVGIGTWRPTHRFHVVAPGAVGLFESSQTTAYLRLSTSEGLDNRVEITNRTGGRFSVWTPGGNEGKGGDYFNVTRDGKVGIWTTKPGFALDVADRIRLRQGPAGSAGLWLFQTKPNTDCAFIGMAGDKAVGFYGNTGIGWGLTMNTTNGNVGIGTMDPQARLHVNGDIIATGDIVLQNADCAEEFTIANLETIEPGTVMVLGEEDSLCQSTKAYDKRVAGVVSGAGNFKPALILDKQPDSTNRMPIALMGKVYCKVDAQYAPIEVGDLLTTSPTLGHAMKATDSTKAFGAIIGKALKPLDAGTGLIPILVSLQ